MIHRVEGEPPAAGGVGAGGGVWGGCLYMWVVVFRPGGPWLGIGRRFTLMTLQQKSIANSRTPKLHAKLLALEPYSPRRCFGKALRSELLRFAAKRSVLSLTSKSHSSKPLPTRRSLRSRTCDCSKNSTRNAELGAADGNERDAWVSSASSPTDVQPVLDAIVESAARSVRCDDAVIHRVDGDMLRSGALIMGRYRHGGP